MTQGDSLLKTDLVRAQTGVTGAGIKVGIISDGVDHWTTARDTGDLPSDLTVLSNSVGGDEGTAMLEIVYDMVPDADLYFHDCGSSTLDFNDAIDSLVSAGCNVICDDIGWIAQPFFEDGIVAQHVNSVLASHNIVYVSSAGNAGSDHYQGLYVNGGDGFADFRNGSSSSNKYLYASVPAGSSITVIMQWNDRFGSSSNDYDLYLFNANTMSLPSSTGLLAGSASTQDGNDDPLEGCTYTNTTGSSVNVAIVAQAYGGAAQKTLELYTYCDGSAYVYTDNIVAADSIFGHPAVPDVIACGALAASSPSTIEYFSSLGPVTMVSGTRQKPDICGIDGVAVTGAGGFPNPFYGTSASAPGIAAVAAILESRFPTKTPAQIKQLILNNTVDLGSTGYDNTYGYGRSDALAAALSSLYVTFDSQGGSAVAAQLVAKNGKATKPADPTKTSRVFGGWYKEAACTNAWNFSTDTVTADTKLYAKWNEFTIKTNGTYDLSSYGEGAILQINSGLTVTLTNNQSLTYYDMQIECGQGVNLTVNSVKIHTSDDSMCPLSFTGDGNKLTIQGASWLVSQVDQPGIRVESGTSLEISGTGAVTATGLNRGAGIGGRCGYNAGTITINSGTVNAYGNYAAGIGGGSGGNGGIVNINGGTVNANGQIEGAGIGGGSNGSGGTVVISGGIVNAKGGGTSCDIGYGTGGSGGSLLLSGEAIVLLKNGTSINPNTSTHEYYTATSKNSDKVFINVPVPSGWDAPIYVYLNKDKIRCLEYVGNGGEGSEKLYFYDCNISTTLKGLLKKSDLMLTGWNTHPDGSGTNYMPGITLESAEDVTLYAQWEEMFEGQGTLEDPYLIETAGHLSIMSQLVNSGNTSYTGEKYYLQTKDIDLSGCKSWVPIGSYEKHFVGTYDGNNKNISNLTILNPFYCNGIFGYAEGTLKNIKVDGRIDISSSLSSSIFVGSVVGWLEDGIIQNCTSSVNINASTTTDSNWLYMGGIVGYMYYDNGIIQNCSNSGDLFGKANYAKTGGIVGVMLGGTTVNNCSNNGYISVQSQCPNAGGIVGMATTTDSRMSYISECFNTGTIIGTELRFIAYMGGIAGYVKYTDVSDCFNTGHIEDKAAPFDFECMGGIVGRANDDSTSIHECYNIGTVDGGDYNGGISGFFSSGSIASISTCYYANTSEKAVGNDLGTATSGTLTELKQQATYSGFDFDNIWAIVGGERFPVLRNTPFVYVSGVSLPEVVGVDVGGSRTVVPSFTPGNASNKQVSWTSSNPSVATVDDGVITLLQAGTANITVTSMDGGYSDTCTVNVRIPVSSLSLNKNSATLIQHSSENLIASVQPDDASSLEVTWSSSKPDVATVDQTGKVTAVFPGTAIITATADGVSDTCEVTVEKIAVSSVTLNSHAETMTHHDTLTLSVEVSPDKASYPQVTWSSDNMSVATVDQTGKVTAKLPGTATITANADGVSDTCEITVEKIAVTSVTLNKTDEILPVNGSLNLTATVLPENASYQEITWDSSNELVATVSQNGQVTAVSVGTATITATADGISDACTVHVVSTSIQSSYYTVDRTNSLLRGVAAGTSVSALKSHLGNYDATIKVYDSSGNEYTGNAVGTGMTVKLIINGALKDQMRVLVLGDTNGDGRINIADYTLVRLDLMNLKGLTGIFATAGDINRDGGRNVTDYTLIKLDILGLQKITASN
jgi:uncharacterized repeat protein (TIGR02543 family)